MWFAQKGLSFSECVRSKMSEAASGYWMPLNFDCRMAIFSCKVGSGPLGSGSGSGGGSGETAGAGSRRRASTLSGRSSFLGPRLRLRGRRFP